MSFHTLHTCEASLLCEFFCECSMTSWWRIPSDKYRRHAVFLRCASECAVLKGLAGQISSHSEDKVASSCSSWKVSLEVEGKFGIGRR